MCDKVVSRVLHFEPQSDVMSQHITVITQGFNEKNFIIFDCFVQWSSTSFFGYRSHHHHMLMTTKSLLPSLYTSSNLPAA